MLLRKLLPLTLALALCFGLAAAPASAAQVAEILWLPEGVRFGSELRYDYVPELGWLDVSLDEDGFVPAIYDMNTGTLLKEYDHISSFSEGLARVSKNGKDGFIDPSGTVVIPLVWDTARDFHDGVAVTMLERPCAPPYEEYTYLNYYIIDTAGTVLAHLGPEYGNVSEFNDGIAHVWEPGTDETWYINAKGEVVEPPEGWKALEWPEYDEGNLIADTQGRKWGIVDKAGNVVVPYEYDYASWITEGPESQPGRYRYVQKGDRFGLVKDPAWQDAPPIISAAENTASSDPLALARLLSSLHVPMPWPMLWVLFIV